MPQEGTSKKPSHFKVPHHCQTIAAGIVHIPPEVCQSVTDILARVGDKWSALGLLGNDGHCGVSA